MQSHRSIKIFISFTSFLSVLFLGSKSYTEYSVQTPKINIAIINSYAGDIQRTTGNNLLFTGGQQRTNKQTLALDISATTGSQFEMNGDIIAMTGDGGITAYTTTRDIVLLSGDGTKQIQTIFWRGNEPYYSKPLSIMLDTTPPTIPMVITPYDNSILTGIIEFTRTGSQDLGVGVSNYSVHLSLDPGFLGETTIQNVGTTLSIASSDLPQGTVFRYVEAKDFLGNSSKSAPQFFHNTINSTISVGAGGRGRAGGGTTIKTIPTITTNTRTITITGTASGTSDNIERTTILPNLIKLNQQTTGENPQDVVGQSHTIKQILLSKYNTIITQNGAKVPFTIPSQEENAQELHNSAITIPDASLYKNTIKQYYYNIKPLGYTVNYVSWIVAFGYIVLKKIIFFLQNHKKSIKIFDK